MKIGYVVYRKEDVVFGYVVCAEDGNGDLTFGFGDIDEACIFDRRQANRIVAKNSRNYNLKVLKVVRMTSGGI